MRVKQRLYTDTPDMLVVGIWVGSGDATRSAAVMATYRTDKGEVRPNLFKSVGEPLTTLAMALKQLAGARNLLLLTNDGELQRLFSRPWCYSDFHPNTWPPEYFSCLTECTRYCLRGTWKAERVDDLPKVRALWEQENRNGNPD